MKQQPSGIRVGQMRVPIGVFGMIFEPAQSCDRAAACRSRAATPASCAAARRRSNRTKALARLVQQALEQSGLPADAVQLVPTTDREAVGQLIAMPEYVDVIIPRGGKGLIERISRDAKVPVIKHLDGNLPHLRRRPCDIAMAVKVADNAKTQKYSPCNATESLLVARGVGRPSCRKIGAVYAPAGRGMRCCPTSQAILRGVCRRPEGRDRAGLVGGIPGARHQREGGGRASTRRSRINRYRQPPHRGHPDHRPPARDAVPARGRFEQRDGQRQHPLRRRLRIQAGRRDRHQHRQVPRARTGRRRG